VKAIRFALLGLVVLLGLVGAVGYSYLKPAPAPSAGIQALALDQTTPAVSDSAVRVYEIVPEESQARFVVDEVLQGAPKTVVGATDQVAGQIALDPSDLGSVQVGTILIDARTFATDSSQRDRAIQNQILKTAQNQYIVFTPTGLVGLPDTASTRESGPVQIPGDLTIGGVTRPVTFDATVTPASADRLEGSASTTIRYADWGISVPSVPLVASVADTVQLQLDFAAQAA
jgi:polyisoprenoid-binding protein YceI